MRRIGSESQSRVSTETIIRKIDNIQALRGIAATMVLFTHCMGFESVHLHERLLPDWMVIGNSGVDLFFVISGFIMVHVTRGAFQKPAGIGEFVFNRLTRIYPLYWFYTLVFLAGSLLRRGWMSEPQDRATSFVASFLLLPQDAPPLLVPGWSLVFEMYFYTVFVGLLCLPERRAPLAVALWAAGALAAYFLLSPFQSPLLTLITSPYCMEFALGCVSALLIARGKIIAGALPGVAVGIALLALAASVHFFGGDPAGPWRVVVYGVPYGLLVYALVAAELSGTARSPRWLVHIGDGSYSLYLSHFLIVAGIFQAWAFLDMKGVLDNGVVIVLAIAIALAWANISYRFLERPILRRSALVRDRLFAGAGMLKARP
jgi:peptidoglycan/LPS O-acetylase OafA/YrhL